MLQRYGMISVLNTPTAKMNTAHAGILKSVDIQDVFARKTTMLLLAQNAHHVSQHRDVINVSVAIV